HRSPPPLYALSLHDALPIYTTMYILCGMLIAGLICNYLIKPVNSKWHMSADEVAKLQAASAKSAAVQTGSFGIDRGGFDVRAALDRKSTRLNSSHLVISYAV